MTALLDPAAPPDGRPLRRCLRSPAVIAVAIAGALIRVWILLSPQGELYADEAYTGLQAIDITRGHIPLVIGGAAYTGTIDTFFLAPLLRAFGQPVVGLKLMSPILWAVAAVVAVGAARRLLGDREGMLAGGLVWLAPGALAVLSTRSYVAYALGLGLVLATIWSACVAVDEVEPRPLTSASLGALAGLAVYTHPMFAAVVGPVALVVATRHRRSGRTFWAPAVGAAVAVNLPFLLWNAKNSWPSLDQPPNTSPSTYAGRLRGFFTGLLPRDLGVRRISNGDWVAGRAVAVLVVVAVLAVVVAGAIRLINRDRWRGAVVVAPLALMWFLLAGLSNLSFVDDGRYGIVVFPVLVLAFSEGVAPVVRRLPDAGRAVVTAVWVLGLTMPFLAKEAGSDLGDPNADVQAIIEEVDAAGFDRLAGNYFAVLPVEYISGSRIRTAIAGNPPVIRLPATQRLVEATAPERLAYIFSPGPIDPSWVKLPLDRYRQVPVAGYVLYFPT
jgi:hypothetical protein